MTHPPLRPLRRGWTAAVWTAAVWTTAVWTAAVWTAAVWTTKATLTALLGGRFPDHVTITLPRGEPPDFAVTMLDHGAGWAAAGIIKNVRVRDV